jgi:SAM-dependent methyltransferase
MAILFAAQRVNSGDTRRDNAEHLMDVSTDSAWEEWGKRDPYFGVITDPKFRRKHLSEQSRQEFFESGRVHVDYIMKMVRNHVDKTLEPKRILDFGCGVGRTLLAFAAIGQEVVGLDVSPSMLQEARQNCEEFGARNVSLLPSDDDLSLLTGQFDLIHSCIVFQHIQAARGSAIFSKLLQYLRPAGVGAVQVTYSKSQFASTNGVPPPVIGSPVTSSGIAPAHTDPEMQMNPYNMNEWLFLMQRNGISRFQAEFTDHGGELGLFFFFQKP